MNSKLCRVISVVLASVMSLGWGVVQAREGFYAGAGAGLAHIKIDESGVDFDSDDLGWKLFAGYRFNEYFGVEGGYVDFGDQSDSFAGTNVKVDADGLDLYAVGFLPVAEDWDLFGKVGFIAWNADVKAFGQTEDDDGEDLALGAGAAWHVNETFALRAEFEWFDIDDTDEVWLLSLGGAFKF